MPSIDERVVAMSFENAVFEQRVSTTMATLTKLDTAIKNVGGTSGFDKIEASASKVTLQGPMSALDKLRAKLGGAGQGAAEGLGEIERAGNKVALEGPITAIDKVQTKLGQVSQGAPEAFGEIEKAASRVSLEGLTSALDSVASKFSVLQGAASVALGGIAANAAMKGTEFSKSFAIGPIVQGFQEYQTNLNSIQTILANTKASGADLDDVNAALQQLNTYSDQTIYNFSQMANSIGLFTAAGVDLKTSVASIKGLANLAALSGSNNEQATHAMQQLSQAIAAGKVTMQDWISVRNAGMGGTVFQRALAQTAEAMGTLDKGSVKLTGSMKNAQINGESFADSIRSKPGEQSWLTSKVLTTTLAGMTGDLTDAQLAAQGFNGEQIQSIQQTAKAAKLAATEVKTLPQAFDVAKETIGSGWSATFQTIFGNFTESKKTFTDFSNTINGFINANANARNKVLADWKKLGGRTDLIDGIKAAFEALKSVIKPVSEAFREIFPRTTGKQLSDMTKNFKAFAESLKIDPATADNIKRTFAGIFAVFDIAKRIIGGVIGVIFDLVGAVGKSSGGFLSFTGGIGDFLVALDQALAKGDLLKSFFNGVSAVIQLPLKLLSLLAHAIANLFGGSNENTADNFKNSLDDVGKKLGPLKGIIDKVVDGWNAMGDALGRVVDLMGPFLDQVGAKLSGIGDVLANAFKSLDYTKILQGLQVGFVGGIFLILKKAFTGGGATGGIFAALKKNLGSINEVLEATTSRLSAMEKKVQAETLLAIAAAVAALAGGIYILSTIDGEKLQKAMTAVAIGLGELMGAMKLMTSGLGKTAALQMPLIAAGMIGLAIAVTILAGAVKIFSTLKWEEIGKGLAGVAGSLVAVAAGMQLMPASLPLTAVGLILVGVGLNAIAVAVKQFGAMDLGTIGKGIGAVVVSLVGIGLAMQAMPATLPLTAAGLILMGIALAAVGGAVKSFGSMDFNTLVKGIGAMVVAIAGIGLAMQLVPPTIALTAAGLLILGQAMVVTAGAIALLGNLGVGTLVKGLTGMAGALVILALGLTAMIASLPGSAALLVAATALAVMVPVLGILGTMKWSTIFKGLGAIALVLVTIGVAGLIAAPALTALGVALIPLGIGFLLVATAAKMFAGAIALLSDEGQKGFALFLTALTGFVAVFPTVIVSFVKGLLSIVDQVAQLAPKVVVALGLIIDTVIAFIIASAPKLAIAIGVLVDSLVQVLAENTPKLVAAGILILMALLNGISQNITQITNKAAEIITKFLNALSANAPRLSEAGAKTIAAFITGIGNNIGKVVTAVVGMVLKFVAALTAQIGTIVSAGQNLILKLVEGIASVVPRLVLLGASIISKFLGGLVNAIPEVKNKALAVARAFLNNLADGLVGLADIGFKAIINFLNGIAQTIRDNNDDLFNAGANIGSAIIDGLVADFGKAGFLVKKAIEKVFNLLPGWAKKILGIKSPSKVFAEIGMYTMLGFAKGVEDNHKTVLDAGEKVATALPHVMRKLLGIHSPSEVMRDIGMQVNRGFAQGLRGSADDVKSAFADLNSKLIDQIRDQKTQLVDNQKQVEDLQQQHADKLAEIAKLRSQGKDTTAAVKEAADLEAQLNAESAAMNTNEAVLKRSRDARRELTVGMKDEKKELLGLRADYDAVTKALENAQQKLDSAIQAREDARKSLTDKFDQTPTVDDESKTKVQDYIAALTQQIAATKSYTDTLAKLRAMGLDDTTYQKLLDEGLAGKDFAEQLLKGGQGAVASVNALDAQLLTAAQTLSNNAAKELYDAGVNAAQALVDGLKARQGALETQMEALAKAMVAAIKRQLKIKSPSRVLLEVGKFAAQGVVDGLRGSSQAVQDAAASIGDDAASAMSDGLSHISDVLSSEIDPDLTITPVLDLTQFQRDAQQLSLANVIPITAAASFGQAASISAAKSAADSASDVPSVPGGIGKVEFNQTNTSPESLSEVEIYRQTNNQIAKLKSLVGVP